MGKKQTDDTPLDLSDLLDPAVPEPGSPVEGDVAVEPEDSPAPPPSLEGSPEPETMHTESRQDTQDTGTLDLSDLTGDAPPEPENQAADSPLDLSDLSLQETEADRLAKEHGPGGRVDVLNAVLRGRAAQSGGIPEAERYAKPEGTLGTVLDALSYPSNIATTGLVGALRGYKEKGDLGDAWERGKEYAGQAYNKQRKIDVHPARKEILGEIHPQLGKSFSQKDKQFDAGDLIDLAIDIPFAFFTDPMTLVSGGTTAALKVAKPLARLPLGQLESLAKGVNVADDLAREARNTIQTGRALGAAGLGLYGASLPGPDASLGERAAAAAATGAAVYYGVAPALRGSLPLLKKGADGAYEAYMVASRGPLAKGIAASREIASKVHEETIAPIRNFIIRKRLENIQHLKPDQKAAFSAAMDEQANAFIAQRNARIANEANEILDRARNARSDAQYQVESIHRDLADAERHVEAHARATTTATMREKTIGQLTEQYAEMKQQLLRNPTPGGFADVRAMEERLKAEGADLARMKDEVAQLSIGLPNKTYIKALRKDAESASVRAEDFTQRLNKLEEAAQGPFGGLPKERANAISTELNLTMDSPEYWAALSEKYDQDILQAMRAQVATNKQIIGMYNAAAAKAGRGEMPGIWWHSDNPGLKQGIVEAEEGIEQAIGEARKFDEWEVSVGLKKKIDEANTKRLVGFKAKTKDERNAGLDALTRDQSYAVYAQRAAQAFMTKTDAEAMRHVAQVQSLAPRGGYARLEAALRGQDWVIDRFKAHVLGKSLTWLKTNFTDSLTKTAMMNGFINVLNPKTWPAFSAGLARDLLSSPGKAISRLPKNKMFGEMVDNGVVSSNLWKDHADEVGAFLYTPDVLEKMEKAKPGVVARLLDLTAKPGFAIGQFMEDWFRANTYMRFKDHLKQVVPGIDDKVAQKASADLVSEMFFDYQKVHPVEQAVLKRILPFYTFFSRNARLWSKQLEYLPGQNQLRKLEAGKRAVGTTPTEKQQAELPRYAKQGARVLSDNPESDIRVLSHPQSGFYDYLRMANPLDWFGEHSEVPNKLNPMIGLGRDVVSGEEAFSGRPLYPWELTSDTKKEPIGVKNYTVGARGYPKAVLNKFFSEPHKIPGTDSAFPAVPEMLRDWAGLSGHYIDPNTRKSIQVKNPDIRDNGKVYDPETEKFISERDFYKKYKLYPHGKSSVIRERALDVMNPLMPPAVTQIMNAIVRPQLDPDSAGDIRFNAWMSPQILEVPKESREINKRFSK